ncbi:ABC transporter permease subunit [Pelagicoccus albus]|uniref:ABC transporter permease n=1 Tax=Pelagicoccus albus TaxID=415222 RepID=A0A7X1EB57_9BACT|nr:ABC transporter permease subunit [Pelagicoccus albus]MBC2607447.1 ABC transporter permease [Pelagicoccus albus]
MNGSTNAKASFGAIRGLVFIKIRELTTPFALARSGAVFGIALVLLGLLAWGSDDFSERYLGLIRGVFALTFLPIFCLTKGGETLRSEMKDGTIEYLWTRPVGKVELFFGFYLSSLLGCFAIIYPALLGISLVGLIQGAIGVSSLLLLWVTVTAVVASFAAISGAISSFTSKFVVFGIFYYSFVELGLGAIPNGVQRLAISYHAEQLLYGLDGSSFLDGTALGYILATGALGLAVGASLFAKSKYVVGGEKES